MPPYSLHLWVGGPLGGTRRPWLCRAQWRGTLAAVTGMLAGGGWKVAIAATAERCSQPGRGVA